MLLADNLGIIKWFIDALHAIRNDCKGHTGAKLTLGSGTITSLSQKQKIDGKSSIEAKLIAVDEALPQILWTRYFMEGQGYDITKNTLYQDNKSAIILEKNGKTTNSKRTKHIKVRYFFIKDKLDQGEINLK